MEEGYEVEALHYLVKPLSEEKVRLCLEKAKGRRQLTSYVVLWDIFLSTRSAM